MKTIKEQAIDRVSNGARFVINFQKRTLKVGRRNLIKNGEFKGELGYDTCNEPLQEIERLYIRYKNSVLSERSERKSKTYFRALSEDKISDEDILFGECREISQLKLELFILSQLILDNLNWDDFAEGKWFWQSEVEPSLVILKQWITNTNNK